VAGDRVVLRIQLPREKYEELKRIAEEKGYSLPSDLVKTLIEGLLEGSPTGGSSKGVEQEIRRLERRIADLLNPYTGKLDEILRRLGEIQELLEECQSQPARPPREPAPEPPRPAARPAPSRPRAQQWQRQEERPRRQYRSGIERLRGDKVVRLSDVKWMRMPDRFFDKLRREGAIVFQAGGETVAVDPDYWREFLGLVERYSVRDPEEMARILEEELGERAAMLFNMLVRSGLAYFDEEAGGWVVELEG